MLPLPYPPVRFFFAVQLCLLSINRYFFSVSADISSLTMDSGLRWMGREVSPWSLRAGSSPLQPPAVGGEQGEWLDFPLSGLKCSQSQLPAGGTRTFGPTGQQPLRGPVFIRSSSCALRVSVTLLYHRLLHQSTENQATSLMQSEGTATLPEVPYSHSALCSLRCMESTFITQ